MQLFLTLYALRTRSIKISDRAKLRFDEYAYLLSNFSK